MTVAAATVRVTACRLSSGVAPRHSLGSLRFAPPSERKKPNDSPHATRTATVSA